MSKTHIYFVPGLAANSKIFERISLDNNLFECHFLEWKMPLSKSESIQSYTQRMCKEIKHENPVLIGVSFGGIMAQEMSKIITTKKVIIISSVKSNLEFPNRFKFAKHSKVYKLFPSKIISNIEAYEKCFFGDFLKKRAELYKTYMSVRNPDYLHWAIACVLHWQQTKIPSEITHIHGTKDGVFPIKNISNCIEIENGTHAMILTKAKKISLEIHKALIC